MDAVVRNIVTVKGAENEVRGMLDSITSDEAGDGGSIVFDFGKVLPEPEYDPMDGPFERHRWRCLKWGCKETGKHFRLLDRELGYAKFQFDTLWGFPYPVFRALATKYRNLDFSCCYAEDDIGFNAGWNGYHWDSTKDKLWEDESDREGSIAFCCKVWGLNRKKWERDNPERVARMREELAYGKGETLTKNSMPGGYDNFDTRGNYDFGTLSDWFPGSQSGSW